MALLAYVITYLAIAVLVVAVIARVVMWTRMPIHMRWELYPVAHEGHRAHYGGSYLEDVDWWKKPRSPSMLGELKVMIPEILFLVALKEHNPKLWIRSFPFHLGVYLVALTTGLMFLGGVLGAISAELLTGGFGRFLATVIQVCAFGGLGLGALGAIGLLQQRLTHPDLKDSTTPADIFNLLFFVGAFGLALVNLALFDPRLGRSMLFVQGLVTFQLGGLPGGDVEVLMTTTSAVLLALLVAYIPLTHMSHFVGKYFAYHAIRWNDDPNLRGGKHEQPIGDVLNYPVSWAASHIGADGKKTWADVATDLSAIKEQEKK